MFSYVAHMKIVRAYLNFKCSFRTRGIRDLNAGPGVGWLVRPSGRYFFFDLPIFWPENSLETPHEPLSDSIRSIEQVSCCKTDKGSNDSDLSVCNCCCRYDYDDGHALS